MTTTKLIYVAAVIVPGGFLIAATFFAAHALWKRHQAQAAAASR